MLIPHWVGLAIFAGRHRLCLPPRVAGEARPKQRSWWLVTYYRRCGGHFS